MVLLKIGLLVPNVNWEVALKKLVTEMGFSVAKSMVFTPERLLAAEKELLTVEEQLRNSKVDAWVLIQLDSVSSDQMTISELLSSWLAEEDCPVIVDHGTSNVAIDTDQWRRRLKTKLLSLPGTLALAATERQIPKEVWVLAASTGGPQALVDFVSGLPDKTGIAFICVQHIEDNFLPDLQRALTNHCKLNVYQPDLGSVLQADDLALISPTNRTKLEENGTFYIENKPWLGDYSPSMDSMIANIARLYGVKAGVIIFTGMGDDGAAACRLMNQQGGKVWVQDPKTCVVSSMPDSVNATEVTSFQGAPKKLAEKLSFYLKRMQLISSQSMVETVNEHRSLTQ